jgi:hypothetical protein
MQMRKSIFKQTLVYHSHPVHPTDICVKNQSKIPHHLRARGDNKNKKKDPEQKQ